MNVCVYILTYMCVLIREYILLQESKHDASRILLPCNVDRCQDAQIKGFRVAMSNPLQLQVLSEFLSKSINPGSDFITRINEGFLMVSHYGLYENVVEKGVEFWVRFCVS